MRSLSRALAPIVADRKSVDQRLLDLVRFEAPRAPGVATARDMRIVAA